MVKRKKVLSRVYDLECENKEYWSDIIEYIKKGKGHAYFVAFRTQPNRISIYYKGREAIALIPKKKDKWMIRPRGLSSTKIENSPKKAINVAYEEALLKNGFRFNQQKMEPGVDYIPMLEAATIFLDKYYKDSEEEKTIQNDIACRYQKFRICKDGKHTLLCVDQEYNQCFENTKEKEDSGILGRYDLLMLEKISSKYKLIFVELKSNLDACINGSSAVINHVSDIEYFFEQYARDAYSARTIMEEGIMFALERKRTFGFIDEEITKDMIDFAHPEFWILYDMVDKAKEIEPKSKGDVEALVDREVERAKHIKETYFASNKTSNVDIYEKGILKHPVMIGKRSVLKSDLSERDIVEVKKRIFEKRIFHGDFEEIL